MAQFACNDKWILDLTRYVVDCQARTRKALSEAGVVDRRRRHYLTQHRSQAKGPGSLLP